MKFQPKHLLDSLPRTRLGCLSREVPAFRTCGIAGFYLAILTLIAGGLLAGRSPVVLAGLAAVCAVSFFVYTYLRKWITGFETLVLLEHVWFALACVATWLWAFDEPILPYLDVVAVSLCTFLAAGRIGCTLVGCCHGLPASVGIVYPDSCSADGFPRHLVGIRLFPVPAIEATALAIIGLSGFCALPFAAPGRVLVWFLLSYAVVRFGLEGIRGDKRPHWLGLSQARWMAIAEVAVVLASSVATWPITLATFVLLIGWLLLAVVLGRRWNLAVKLLTSTHLMEFRRLVLEAYQEAGEELCASPIAKRSSLGVSVAVSVHDCGRHVSLSLPALQSDLPLLCALACRTFPELDPATVHLTRLRVLHFTLPVWDGVAAPSIIETQLELTVYGDLVRRLQNPILETVVPPLERLPVPLTKSVPPARRRPWWFSTNGH